MRRSFLDMAAFERRALLFLLLLMLMVALFRKGRNERLHPWPELDLADFLAQLDSMEHRDIQPLESLSDPTAEIDPNTDDEQVLISKGIRQRLARNMVNYRDRFGPYTDVAQLGRLYALKPGEWERIKAYIRIREIAPRSAHPTSGPNCEEVELNSASDSMLVRQLGLGSALARRVVAYRSLLGGFATVEQLSEVYGMAQETLDRVSPCLRVNPARLVLLDLQGAAFGTLLRHPYLDLAMVKQLVDWRKEHELRSATQLLTLPAWDSAAIRRIGPYILWKQ